MKYIKYLPLAFLVLILILSIIPTIADKHMNPISSEHNVYISKTSNAFHKEMFVADMHADSLLWKRDLTKKSYRGHLDFVRMQEGGIDLQVFTVVTKSPKGINIHRNDNDTDSLVTLSTLQMWPIRTWLSPFERAVYQAEKLLRYEKEVSDFILVRDRADLTTRLGENDFYGLLGLEGAHAIEEDLENHFQRLFELGFRLMGLTHFFDNKLAGSAHGIKKGGLTEMGKDFVLMANEYSVIIDLAHASEAAIEDSLRISQKPMVVSHTGLKGHCDNARNIRDDLAKQVAARGGLVGIGFWPTAVCGSSVDDIVSAIRYAVRLLGDNHVALGSDFDGAVQVPFGADKLIFLSQRLLDAGFSETSIKKIMGQNVKRFLQNNLPNANGLPE